MLVLCSIPALLSNICQKREKSTENNSFRSLKFQSTKRLKIEQTKVFTNLL